MKPLVTILTLSVASIILVGATTRAEAGSRKPCVTASRLIARVDAHNVLTTHVAININTSDDTTFAYSADMYRRGVREYHDEAAAKVTTGTTNGDSMVELPLSWRGERLTIRMHAATACGSVDRVAVVTTPRRPLP